MENAYCRFCAEPKISDKLLNLENNEKECSDTLQKLAFLNALYVDLEKEMLPKTVCFVCCESLNKAYEFLKGIERAQKTLLQILTSDPKCDLSDDDRDLDDFITHGDDIQNVPEVKKEIPPDKYVKNNSNRCISVDIEVKNEPKEELPDATGLLEIAISNIDNHEEGNFGESINVQDILDAAMGTMPLSSDITIYAKELTDVSKKNGTWKDYPWVCKYCNIEFLDLVTLRSHSKVVHNKCAAFTCIDCKAFVKYDSFKSFLNHVRGHREMLRDCCQYCDQIIKTKSLKKHIKEHFVKSQLPCPACGEIIKNEDMLKIHLTEYNSIKPKRKPRRKRGTPLTIEDLTCKLCKKIYKNPNSLRDHMKLHISDRKRNYTCDRCGKTFFSKGTLTSHIMAHDKIRPHVCRICNKSFLYPHMLRRHVEMHSGVKPFSCEQCGRCFRLQYQLNAHKIIHTDSMPYVCQYCNKAFRFKQILKNHERQHTGAKPYSCQNCGMQFTNWSNYNKHMKRRHGTDTSKKKITPEGVFPINPETGQIVQVEDSGMEEWKTKIMIPAKRGKKKTIKQESSIS